MNDAEIVGMVAIGISTLISLFISVGKPLMDNQKVMVELNASVKMLTNKLDKLETRYNEIENIIQNHDIRIHDLERRKKYEQGNA